MTRETSPRYRLTHLTQALRRGDQGRIADHLRCHPATVSAVLNGKTSQSSDLARNIIRLAEDRVERYRRMYYRK